MALVPTAPGPRDAAAAPRPPARLTDRRRRRLVSTLEDASRDLSADAVLLAGSITDVVAALAAGLWTPTHATRPLPRAPPPRQVSDELGLTLHTVPAWHLDEGRVIAADELDVEEPRRRERAARLAAAAAGARRHGADTVLAGAGTADVHEAGLSLDRARACVERYGLGLVTPFAEPAVQTLLAEAEALASARWRGRSWPAWPLREAVCGRLSPGLVWPMRALGEAGQASGASPSQGDRDGRTAQRSGAGPDR